ncbi:histone-lysine N-methyltransferase SETMAR [Bombina bombina]|uniref:histone-lysine N-methyltransferase SETMAR n=1 Tax=Bombina bombina TaxID=8345 RepID=UPI00235A6B3D|nr:histone-lysine N-methyltransferase SETMAR [Bombina bombina]XP_053576762.1 histone-lysine N-methyltransferase SETMAR [Bombina bombina]XP_053576763.1 histone-lysine N-methyltransferase SETMAR [Bombina bombina]XP_053576765.1 histone-lysine N-methyltransferase SETMAR [Bombina bombina]
MEFDVSGGLESLPIRGAEGQIVNFQYFPDLITGPGAELDPSEVSILGCNCSESCVPGVCTCLPYGNNYVNHRVVNSKTPILECNILCNCGETCHNRETQQGLQFRLQVCRTSGKGLGLCTLEYIPSGRFVCEYAGEVIGKEEAGRRICAQEPTDNNYIIAVREHLHAGQTLETFVDPTHKGNVGRFLNHSCQPNLFMLPVRTHSMVPKLALFAARDILPGEELCYDYSGRYFNSVPDSVSTSQAVAQYEASSGKRCLCETSSCTGTLPYDCSLYQLEPQ